MKGLPSNEMIAEGIARKLFAKRGNRSEAHLREAELACWIQEAMDLRDRLEQYLKNAKVPAGNKGD